MKVWVDVGGSFWHDSQWIPIPGIHVCVILSPWVWAGPQDLVLKNRKRQKWQVFTSVFRLLAFSLLHSLTYCCVVRCSVGKPMWQGSEGATHLSSWETEAWVPQPASCRPPLPSRTLRCLEARVMLIAEHPAELIHGNWEKKRHLKPLTFWGNLLHGNRLIKQWIHWRAECLLMNWGHGDIRFGSSYLRLYIKPLWRVKKNSTVALNVHDFSNHFPSFISTPSPRCVSYLLRINTA